MPGPPLAAIPPLAFTAACTRWAAGTATAYDQAVLTSLTTQTPLPDPYDPLPVGFNTRTRLPPADNLHLFHEAKDAARAAFHSSATHARSHALTQALNAPWLPPPRPPFPTELGAAPARKGLAEAAIGGLGKRVVVVWKVRRADLMAAGPAFVTALKAWGWDVEVDEEGGGVMWRAGEEVSDWDLVRMVGKLLEGVDRDIMAAGESGLVEDSRVAGARVSGLGGLWLRVRVRFGMKRNVIRKRRRGVRRMAKTI